MLEGAWNLEKWAYIYYFSRMLESGASTRMYTYASSVHVELMSNTNWV